MEMDDGWALALDVAFALSPNGQRPSVSVVSSALATRPLVSAVTNKLLASLIACWLRILGDD
jgi:hypothetical protein